MTTAEQSCHLLTQLRRLAEIDSPARATEQQIIQMEDGFRID